MKNLADYISENDDVFMGSSTMKDNDTSKYEDVNESQSTKCELEQYINEQKINEEMNHLTVSVDKMKERMEEIISSTGVIVDNISQLSATSEEIAASSEDGNKNAQDSVERLKECSEVLDKIYQLSQKLSLN